MACVLKYRGWWVVKYRVSAPGTPRRERKVRIEPVDPKPTKRPPPHVRSAAQRWYDLEAQIRGGKKAAQHRQPIGEWLGAYRDSRAHELRPGSLHALGHAISHFTAWCATNQVERVDQLTVSACRAWLAAAAATLEVSTVRTIRAYLAAAWARAVQDGELDHNPWVRARLAAKASTDTRPPYWTEAEINRLVKCCPLWLRDVILLGWSCGARISALLSLTWKDVDFRGGTLRLLAKGGPAKFYRVPILGQAHEVLARLRTQQSGDGVILRGPQGHVLTRVRTYRAIQRRIVRAKVPDHGHCNHILRHSFATNAINVKGIPIPVVARWLGHHSITVTQIYVHIHPDDEKRWTERYE